MPQERRIINFVGKGDFAMYIGVDVGGTKIAVGLVNDAGDILNQKTCLTKAERPFEIVVIDIIKLIKQVVSEGPPVDIFGIGIGIPGIADKKTGNVYECVNLGWRHVPLKNILEEEFKIPVYIENDASAAGLAEYSIGSLKNTRNSVLITLGTGVGGSFIINNKLYSGTNGLASEVGHMVVGDNFYKCNCGKTGCLETFASALALITYTKRLVAEEEIDSQLKKYVGEKEELLDAKIIFELAKENDPIALKAVDRLVKYLAIGISNLIYTLDPEIIAIGGGVSKAGDYLLAKLTEKVDEFKIFKDVNSAKLILAELGNEAGIVGAAMLCKFI